SPGRELASTVPLTEIRASTFGPDRHCRPGPGTIPPDPAKPRFRSCELCASRFTSCSAVVVLGERASMLVASTVSAFAPEPAFSAPAAPPPAPRESGHSPRRGAASARPGGGPAPRGAHGDEAPPLPGPRPPPPPPPPPLPPPLGQPRRTANSAYAG